MSANTPNLAPTAANAPKSGELLVGKFFISEKPVIADEPTSDCGQVLARIGSLYLIRVSDDKQAITITVKADALHGCQWFEDEDFEKPLML